MTALYNLIKNRIFRDKQNCLILVQGEPGTGKSNTAIRIGEQIDPTFTIERVVFTAQDFMDVVDSGLPEGSVIIFDEAGTGEGVPSKQWWDARIKAINYVLQTFRIDRYIIIVTCPAKILIDTTTRMFFLFTIDCLKVKHRKRFVLAKVRQVQYNPTLNKTYTKRIIDGSDYIDPYHFGFCSAGIWDEYSKRKLMFNARVKRLARRDIAASIAKETKRATRELPISYYVDQMLKHKDMGQGITKTFKTSGREAVDVAKVMKLCPDLSYNKALKVKRILEAELDL
jgi:hypothetical protein